MTEDQFIDDYLVQIGDNILAKLKEEPRRHLYFGRSYVLRSRQATHDDLFACYFSDNPMYTEKMFCRRFRMNRPLFLQIVEELGKWSPYFTARVDCTGREGMSPLQKCTAAIRMIAYGTPTDELDENLKIVASTTLVCLGKFAQGVIYVFGE
jgi:hypothetical protein